MRKVIRHGTNLIFEDEKKWRGIIGMTQPFLSGPSATVKLVLIDTLYTICSKVDRVVFVLFSRRGIIAFANSKLRNCPRLRIEVRPTAVPRALALDSAAGRATPHASPR